MTESILIGVIVVLALALITAAMVLLSWHMQREDLRKEIEIGRSENSALLDELERVKSENAEFRQQNKKLYKITIPSFGKPSLKVYNPLEYDTPLVCTKCEKILVVKEDFYEIPIVNDPGTVIAVHLRCEREEKYGN